MVLFALVVPASLLLFHKDVQTPATVEGGPTRTEAVRLAAAAARGFGAETITHLRVVRTSWGAVDEALGQTPDNLASLPVWVVSMKVTGLMALPGGLPGVTRYYDNFYMILDFEVGSRAFGSLSEGQLVVARQ
jgi:hypothetical protein